MVEFEESEILLLFLVVVAKMNKRAEKEHIRVLFKSGFGSTEEDGVESERKIRGAKLNRASDASVRPHRA